MKMVKLKIHAMNITSCPIQTYKIAQFVKCPYDCPLTYSFVSKLKGHIYTEHSEQLKKGFNLQENAYGAKRGIHRIYSVKLQSNRELVKSTYFTQLKSLYAEANLREIAFDHHNKKIKNPLPDFGVKCLMEILISKHGYYPFWENKQLAEKLIDNSSDEDGEILIENYSSDSSYEDEYEEEEEYDETPSPSPIEKEPISSEYEYENQEEEVEIDLDTNRASQAFVKLGFASPDKEEDRDKDFIATNDSSSEEDFDDPKDTDYKERRDSFKFKKERKEKRPRNSFKVKESSKRLAIEDKGVDFNTEASRAILKLGLDGLPIYEPTFILKYGLRISNNSDKPYVCPVTTCHKGYKNPNGIKYHAYYGHSDKRCFPCICGKDYMTRSGLLAHFKIAHPNSNKRELICLSSEFLESS